MNKILFFIALIFSVSVFAGFSSGRSSSFSSGRSSSYSSGRSSYSSGRSSSTSSSSRSSGFSKSSRSDGSNSTSSHGYFGSGSSSKSYFSPPTRTTYTARTALEASPATVYTPSQPISVYHYYYPSYFYGSGYGWYQSYFYYHMFGTHTYCYHQGGGLATVRVCQKNEDCVHGEICDLNKKQCALRPGEWTQ